MAEKSRELTVKVDVDVSEALTGLKALQREAKKATQALKELDEAKNGYDTKEGSVIYHISKELGVPPSDLVKLEPAEISYLFASIKNK